MINPYKAIREILKIKKGIPKLLIEDVGKVSNQRLLREVRLPLDQESFANQYSSIFREELNKVLETYFSNNLQNFSEDSRNQIRQELTGFVYDNSQKYLDNMISNYKQQKRNFRNQ